MWARLNGALRGRDASYLAPPAREAALLAEGQHITQAKTFRRAKNSLGIQSIREGFGANGGWAWELPRDHEGSAHSPSLIRSQIACKERPIPREWLEGIA